MSSSRAAVLTALLLVIALVIATPVTAQCIVNINTGYDDAAGTALPEGVEDLRYTVDAGFGPLPALTGGPTTGFPIPPWVQGDEDALWISSSPNSIDLPGLYTYSITVEVPGDAKASALSLEGRWSTDDPGVDIAINGTSTGLAAGGFTTFSEFPVGAGFGLFQPGENVIEFIVENGGIDPNPTGLRVEGCIVEAAAEGRPFDISTGFDEAIRALLPDGVADDAYTISGPLGDIPATTVPEADLPFSWVANDIQSRWVGPAGAGGPLGEYIYAIDVDLPAGEIDAGLAVLRGSFTADDAAVDVLVNGEPTGLGSTGPVELTAFPVQAAQGLFRGGPNTVEFIVFNNEEGPTGLRVNAEIVEGPPDLQAPPSLFSVDTGFDDENRTTIANALPDDHWIVLGPPGSDIGPVFATVVPDDQFPIGPWLGTTGQSKWIGLDEVSSNGPAGTYTFRITVSLPDGFDAGNARLVGSWSSDNGIADVLINGESTGLGHDGNFTALAPIAPDAGLGLFRSGENLIEVLVTNAPPDGNPVGLRIEAVVGSGPAEPRSLSTGFDPRGVGPLPGGVPDPRYLVGAPDEDGFRPAVVIADDGFPIPPWVASTEMSRWIGLDGDDSAGIAGTYLYEVPIDLPPALNAFRAVIEGSWAAAGSGSGVILNGNSLELAAEGPENLTPFPPDAGLGSFIAGRNSLRFIVENPAEGSTGLRVDASLATRARPSPLDISTGISRETGTALDPGAADTNYSVTDPFGVTEEPVVLDAATIAGWLAGTSNSRWIGIAGGIAASPGIYRFQTTVELATPEEAGRATIVGFFAFDDTTIDVLINDVSSGITGTGGFAAPSYFPPDAGLGLFIAGENLIEFIVENGGVDPNPSGLRVDAWIDTGEPLAPPPSFVRGDVDSDGSINLTDGIALLSHLFQGTEAPACRDAADTDDNGRMQLTDAIVVFQFLFLGEAPPRDPSPPAGRQYDTQDCGPDPTADDLECAELADKCAP